jgi:hypothetical protein
MEPKRPFIPMQVQAFRRRRWRKRWPWVVAAGWITLLLIWLVSRAPGESQRRWLPRRSVQRRWPGRPGRWATRRADSR